MKVDWAAIEQVLVPIRDYAALQQRLREAFAYPFICNAYNFPLPGLVGYTHSLLGGDARQRYVDFEASLVGTISALHHAGIPDVLSLISNTSTSAMLEATVLRTAVSPLDIAGVLKYLAYWVVPAEKYLSGLVRDEAHISAAIKVLNVSSLRTNLEMLQAGLNHASRTSLSHKTSLPLEVIREITNRADFSRLPWSSKATISNIIGAGYASLAELANANPDQLYADFFKYGESIGKNLKLGNEIENSYRIARIIPRVLQ